MKAFCTRHNRALWVLCSISAVFTLCLLATGCNVPAWLQDAQTLVPVILSSVTTVLSFLAALTGNPALAAAIGLITPIINDVNAGLTDLEQIIAQYKANPSDTLLQKIEEAAGTISANLQKVLTDTGLPAALAQKIQAWAQLALSQLEAWLAILPALHLAATANSMHVLSALKPASDNVMSAKALHESLTAILAAPTGDSAIDAAMDKALAA